MPGFECASHKVWRWARDRSVGAPVPCLAPSARSASANSGSRRPHGVVIAGMGRIELCLSVARHVAVALLPDCASVHSVRPAMGSPPRTPNNKAPHRINWGGTLGERPSLDMKTREASFAAIASGDPLVFSSSSLTFRRVRKTIVGEASGRGSVLSNAPCAASWLLDIMMSLTR
jgi:hypothetical protein